MKKYSKFFTSILFAIILTLVSGYSLNNRDVEVSLYVKETIASTYQLFFDNLTKDSFDETNSKIVNVEGSIGFQKVSFVVPKDRVNKLRFDLGSEPHDIYLKEIRISQFYYDIIIPAKEVKSSFEIKNQITMELKDDILKISSTSNDPYLGSLEIGEFPFTKVNMTSIGILLLIFVSIFILLYHGLKILPQLRNLKLSFKEDIRKIWDFALNDFKRRYAGSYFGIIWAFVQPVITIIIYWGVFQIGFRSPPINNFPYLLWFIPGLIPWFFFSDIIMSSLNCLMEYSYLVKKVVFKIEILPMMKLLVSAFINIFFIVLMLIVYMAYGYYPDVYYLQLIYYTICLMLLAIPIAFFSCAVVVFFRDLGQIVNIVLQFGMWLTPIVWPIDMIPTKYQWIMKVNPVYYFVQGYRDSLMNKIWFWQHSGQTIYFFLVVGIMFIIGIKIFERLKPHFDDAL